MTKTMRSLLVMTAAVIAGRHFGFCRFRRSDLQSKVRELPWLRRHTEPGMAKMMGIKPVSDPSVKAMTVAQMEAAVKNGKGKMKPVAGLTDAQVKDVVTYFRSLK